MCHMAVSICGNDMDEGDIILGGENGDNMPKGAKGRRGTKGGAGGRAIIASGGMGTIGEGDASCGLFWGGGKKTLPAPCGWSCGELELPPTLGVKRSATNFMWGTRGADILASPDSLPSVAAITACCCSSPTLRI